MWDVKAVLYSTEEHLQKNGYEGPPAGARTQMRNVQNQRSFCDHIQCFWRLWVVNWQSWKLSIGLTLALSSLKLFSVQSVVGKLNSGSAVWLWECMECWKNQQQPALEKVDPCYNMTVAWCSQPVSVNSFSTGSQPWVRTSDPDTWLIIDQLKLNSSLLC